MAADCINSATWRGNKKPLGQKVKGRAKIKLLVVIYIYDSRNYAVALMSFVSIHAAPAGRDTLRR